MGFHSECNAFCRPTEGRHAEVAWAVTDLDQYPEGWSTMAGTLIALERGAYPLAVAIEEAPEAPERGPQGFGPHRKLVVWQEP